MCVMTYSDDLLGDSTGQQLSIGTPTAPVRAESDRAATTSFLRPGPEHLSEAIPVFFIGRNEDGFWVARSADGKSGGLFLRKGSAIGFAMRSAWPVRCATIFLSNKIELDLENHGNPFLVHIARARRLLTNRIHRLGSAVRKLPQR